jgi:hypothetical protein
MKNVYFFTNIKGPQSLEAFSLSRDFQFPETSTWRFLPVPRNPYLEISSSQKSLPGDFSQFLKLVLVIGHVRV